MTVVMNLAHNKVYVFFVTVCAGLVARHYFVDQFGRNFCEQAGRTVARSRRTREPGGERRRRRPLLKTVTHATEASN